MPDVLFWIKDAELRLIEVNRAFAERVNLPYEKIIGKNDADFYFPELARVFMEDDQRVMESGEPLHRKVELLANRLGGVEWRSTSKLPIYDKQNRVIGTTGISRPLMESSDSIPVPYQAFSRMVEYCRQNLADGIGLEQMANYAGMSISTLSRRFREHLRISPGEFLSHLRLSRASKLLIETPMSITEITLECGYESPAAFSRAFRRDMHLTPSQYRASSVQS